MKRFISVLAVLALTVSLAPVSFAEDAYLPAPYTVADPKVGPSEYLAPVFYQNENGPTIGVTLVGVVQKDGLYFKDSDNDQELDVFEDWRLDAQTRAADLLGKMTLDQRAGLINNEGMSSPKKTKIADVLDENGNVVLANLLEVTEGDVYSYDNKSCPSTGVILGNESRSGIIRANSDAETGALFNNALNMVTEYAAVAKGEPAIPYNSLSNPIGAPASLGMVSASMADGNYDLVRRYAELDRMLWNAKGIDSMYGPQIDLLTDPRWSRNSGTMGERPEVAAGVAAALVEGYQNGTDGAQDGDVALIMKHFPGDGASENGFESHNKIGEWRLYPTEGSLEKYQLVAFQAAIDAGLTGIMPGYSRPTRDARSAKQTYRGIEIDAEELGNAYNPTILNTLLRDAMGFKGFVNTDSMFNGQDFGVEGLTGPERYAAMVNAGSDTGANGDDFASIREAVNTGLITAEALDRATTNRLVSLFDMGRFENPYRDPAESKATAEQIQGDLSAVIDEINHKSVVLMKNTNQALPMTDHSKKIYVRSFGTGTRFDADATAKGWADLFDAEGFTVVDDPAQADIAFLSVAPSTGNTNYMAVLDLVEDLKVEERMTPTSQAKTGEIIECTTLEYVGRIPGIADAVHANGGVVVATITISNPWILTNLEPYCDALLGNFGTAAAVQTDILTGKFSPVGKLPVTMVSSNDVVAVTEQTLADGTVAEICASPNDVPGYDKDQYIDPAVLANVKGGSYAYQDSEGNYYLSGFGLTY